MCLVTQSYLTLCDPMDCSLPGSSVHEDSPGKNAGVGCHALLQGDPPNPGIKSRSPALQKDSLLSQPPGKPTHNISISIYRYTYIQNTHSAYLYLYLYTHTCNTHIQHVYMYIYIFIYTERLIYYKELTPQLWRQRSLMIYSVSWRHREASGVIPV